MKHNFIIIFAVALSWSLEAAPLKVMFLGLDGGSATGSHQQSAGDALRNKLISRLDVKFSTPEEVSMAYAHEWLASPMIGSGEAVQLAKLTGCEVFIGGAIQGRRDEVQRVGLFLPWACWVSTWDIFLYIIDGASGKKLYQGNRVFQARTKAKWVPYGDAERPFPGGETQKQQNFDQLLGQYSEYFGEIAESALQGLVQKKRQSQGKTTRYSSPATPGSASGSMLSSEPENAFPPPPEPPPAASPGQVEPEISKDGKLIPPRYPKSISKPKNISNPDSNSALSDTAKNTPRP
jgi:hypothetical protein